MVLKKKFVFPQEIDLWYILPTIRKEFAIEMMKKDISQKEIAKKLDLTEAAISYYKKEKRASEVIFNNKIKNEIRKSVEKLITNKSNVSNEIIRIDSLLKKEDIFCKIHKSKCSFIAGCKECRKSYLKK
jgi:predicted transcriptional regulator